jgi:hypothetical protein
MTPDELKARTKDFAVAIVRFCPMLPRDSRETLQDVTAAMRTGQTNS